MKGVILAGGTGSRLLPLTKVTNKHLLPIYNKPMIFYPLESLKKAGIKDIMIVCGTESAGDFLKLLGSGKDYGVNLTYRVQDGSGGIPVALQLAKEFVGNDKCICILGDNVMEDDITESINAFEKSKGARVFVRKVKDPKRYGIAVLDKDQRKIIEMQEKPENPKSDWAILGIYMVDSRVFEVIPKLKPSKRGELEILETLQYYANKGELECEKLNGFWIDAGTITALFEASDFIKRKTNPN